MNKTTVRTYKGTRDWLTAEMILRQNVVATLRRVFEEFGFEPLETPIIELRETLEGKYGDEGNRQTYFFEKGDSQIGLRYDQTVPLARVMAQYDKEISLPYRRYTIGPVFRADNPQKGRLRQFTQCDFDIVGVAGPLADAEIIALTYTALKRLGFDQFEIEIGDRQLLNGMAQALGATTPELIKTVLRSWDKLQKVARPQIAKELKAAGATEDLITQFNATTDRLLGMTGDKALNEIRQLFPNQPQVEAGIKALGAVTSYLEDFGVPQDSYRINPCLARGLDYYTGIIFEAIIKKGDIGSVCGGGRYDNLIKDLGGPDLPATGNSFGLERLTAVMEELKMTKKEETTTQVFVATFDPKAEELVKNAIAMATTLRSAGVNVELYLGDEPIGKQLQLADRRGVRLAVFAGPEEFKNQTVIIKDLATPMTEKDKNANQIVVPKDEAYQKIRDLLSR